MSEETTGAVQTYMEHVTEHASLEEYNRREHFALDDDNPSTEETSLLSVEALPENTASVDFSTFAVDYPEKLLPVLAQLRPEFQELFAEYYILHKSQEFLGKTHGCIQTRVWQNLRIIERAVGALLVLGVEPSFIDMQNALAADGLDHIEFGRLVGSLAGLITLYAKTHDYTAVANAVGAPAPAIRKIFRPAIDTLTASHRLRVAAIGAYLKNLTHQSALTKTGLSKRTLARLRRVRTFRFSAPPLSITPLIESGDIQALKDKPWTMLEISSAHRMEQIRPLLLQNIQKFFGTKAIQIFAPINDNGELVYGYIFARSAAPVRKLLKIRGVAFIVSTYRDAAHSDAVLVPNTAIQAMIAAAPVVRASRTQINDFVEVLSGPASQYCGVVTAVKGNAVDVEVTFPTGRRFLVAADASSVRVIDAAPEQRTFWGVRPTCALEE